MENLLIFLPSCHWSTENPTIADIYKSSINGELPCSLLLLFANHLIGHCLFIADAFELCIRRNRSIFALAAKLLHKALNIYKFIGKNSMKNSHSWLIADVVYVVVRCSLYLFRVCFAFWLMVDCHCVVMWLTNEPGHSAMFDRILCRIFWLPML